MKIYEGKLVSEGVKVGIVVARFNEFITSKLLAGAIDGLKRHEVAEEDIEVAWVPGAFEIPLIASKMAKSGKYDAVIRKRFAALHGKLAREAKKESLPRITVRRHLKTALHEAFSLKSLYRYLTSFL